MLAINTVFPDCTLTILGRGQSGKTVLMASMYHELYRGDSDISARALNAATHDYLMDTHASLASGEWPPVTLGLRSLDMSLNVRGTRVTISSSEASGEIYREVLYDREIGKDYQAALYDQMKQSLGAMLVIDPEDLVKQDRIYRDAEFIAIGIAELLAVRDLSGHLVVVLTKRNRNLAFVRDHGGPAEFVRRFMPRFCEVAPNAVIQHISAVGVRYDTDWAPKPRVTPQSQSECLLPLHTLIDLIDPAYFALLREFDDQAAALQRNMDQPGPGRASAP